MNTEPAPPTDPGTPERWPIWLKGMLIGEVSIGLLYAVSFLVLVNVHVFNRVGLSRMLGIPDLFLVPLVGGLVASYNWRSLRPTLGAVCLNSLWMTLIALAGATLV